MNSEEERIERRGAWNLIARARLSGAIVLAAVLGLGGPLPAAAQSADYAGPAVVRPADSYVASDELEDQVPKWQTTGREERVLYVHFMDPPEDRPDFWEESVRALDYWNEVSGLPLVFRSTRDERSAEVRFRWIRRFDARQAGTTDWETDGEGWLTSVVVTLAMEHEDGTPMGDDFLRMVALHELGHVIGLPHSDSPADVMHPGNRSLYLSDRDIRSARQLYERLQTEKVSAP